MVLHHDAAVHHHRVHAAAVGVVDEIVDGIEEGLPLWPLGVEQHQVRALAGLDGAEVVAHVQGLGAHHRGHLEGGLCGDEPQILAGVLVLDGRHVHGPHHVEMVGVVGRVAAEGDLDALGEQLRHAAVLGHAAAALGRGDGAHDHGGARAGQALDLGVVDAEAVREDDVRPDHPERFEVFRRSPAMAGGVFLSRLGPAAVVERQGRAALVGHALQRLHELGAARLGRERHGPRPHAPAQAPVPFLDEGRRPRDRLLGGEARQLEGGVLIGDALPQDHADAGVLVGLQTHVGEFRAAGIHEAHRAVLQQLDEAEQGRVVLLFLGHRLLQREHVEERARELVREDPAHDVRVADVHVAVDEARRDEQPPSVDHSVGAEGGQLGRLADAADPSVLHEDGSVADDPPLPVQGQDIPRVVDLERVVGHGEGSPFRRRPLVPAILVRRPRIVKALPRGLHCYVSGSRDPRIRRRRRVTLPGSRR